MRQFVNKNVIFYFVSLLIAIFVVIPILLPYFHKGYFPTHDGEWAVVRLGDMYRGIKDLQFPVRYSGNLNFGYGYPLFNFAYPFPYYLGLIFLLFGFGFVGSIKALFVMSIILSAFFMMLFSKSMWKSTTSGIVSGVLYSYFPYHFVDLFVRGSLGESLAFVLFPVILLCLLHSARKKSFQLTLLAGLFYGLLVVTHNIMAVLFTPFLLLFLLLLLLKEQFPWKYGVAVLLVAYGVAAFFWVPALAEKHFVLLSRLPIADRDLYYVSLKQLVLPSWGYNPPTDKDGFSYQVGIFHIIILLLAVVYVFKKYITRKLQNEGLYALSFIVLLLCYIFLLFSISSFFWENMPLFSEINYPWTLLSQVGLLIALLGGYVVSRKGFIKHVVIICTFFSILYSLPYAQPELYVDRGDLFYLTNDATTTSSRELMPLWVKKHPQKRVDDKVILVKGNGTIGNVSYNSHKVTFTGDFVESSLVRINTIYFPGWIVTVNGKNIPITYDNEYGVMDIVLAKGESKIIATFTETPVRVISNTISSVTFGSIGGFFLFKLIKKIKKKI